MISKIFELLYNKIFVNIIIKKSKTLVYIEQSSKNKVINSVEKEFDSIVLDESIQSFIKTCIAESPYYYISILDNSKFQGALPCCSRKKLAYYKNVDADELVCVKDRWTSYTSRDDLYRIEKEYREIGVDFIFSPFVVLINIFKDKLDADIAMFILVEEENLSLSIFSHSQLLYSEYLSIGDTEEDALIEEDIEEVDDYLNEDFGLDEMEPLDEMDQLDDFGNIEDLDALDDIDEFDEFDDSKDIEEEFNNLQEDAEIQTDLSLSGSFKEDYQRYFAIQNSVNNFYSDSKYEGEFIENVYIADTVTIGPDLKRYLEEEMFLSVYVRSINLASSLCDIAKMELKG